ncbi:hypothetical protein K439DRAFT_1619541 [Ramaria rubella]|nr:hypothetical protein K439DRAFT_1619541 [Ramaria rubella]
MPPNLLPPDLQTHDPSKPFPGHVGNLTVPQQHALEKLRNLLQDEGYFLPKRHDDATLLRFLRARKFDLEKAKAMIVNAEEWRKSFGVDDLVKTFDFKEKAEVDKYYPQYYHKTDKLGRPIYIEHLGKLDVKALYSITTPERQLQRSVVGYEELLTVRFPACSLAAGRPIETLCTVLDLDNVSLGQFYRVKDYVMQTASLAQDRYPECMAMFYIINAPYLFSTVWAFVRPWLDEVTVAKVCILGRDYKGTLLEQIPMENLPKDLGGGCGCEGGCSMSDAGPWNKGERVIREHDQAKEIKDEAVEEGA